MRGTTTPTGGGGDRFAAWLLASVSLLAVIGDFVPAYPDWITGVNLRIDGGMSTFINT